jgi:hypothetical protein
MRTERIIIYPKDIQRITGKSERYGRLMIKRIKDRLGKEDHQFVSVEEFCAYTGLKYERVTECLLG